MRILLVEDDPETAGYLEEGLRGENRDLHVAADGRLFVFTSIFTRSRVQT